MLQNKERITFQSQNFFRVFFKNKQCRIVENVKPNGN